MAELARLYTNGCPHQHQCHVGSENVGKTGWGRSSDVVGAMMTKLIRGRGNPRSRSKSISEEWQMRESVPAPSLTTRAPICIARPPPRSASRPTALSSPAFYVSRPQWWRRRGWGGGMQRSGNGAEGGRRRRWLHVCPVPPKKICAHRPRHVLRFPFRQRPWEQPMADLRFY